jgi:CO dehydrogenase/acetyl-CoA synthase gamma subunit (corrinoid Fe-S protein)
MLLADVYLDRIDFLKYLPQTDCGECGVRTCQDFVASLKSGEKRPQKCPGISQNLYYPFQIALEADKILPRFTCVTDPRPGPVGLVEINSPGNEAPLLISGNHIHTQDVMTSILSTTRSPFFLLCTDTKGHTVDMAVIYNTITAEQIRKDIQTAGIVEMAAHHEIITPGLAGVVSRELRQSTGWKVTLGPICAAELPLFLAEKWLPPLTPP